MKKVLLFTAVMSLSLVSTTGFAKDDWDGRPTFEKEFIKIGSSLFLCGGVTIAPIGDQSIRVQSMQFKKGLVGSEFQPATVLSKGWQELPSGGFRVKYNWPGIRKQFRIFCQRKGEFGVWNSIDCSKAVRLDLIKHGKYCGKVAGALGAATAAKTYKPLNLK
ncbi:hypothetical protein E3J61_04060 [Candidatus Dependentiae bacterium]|nr:MAG: hypothetical protein E3J61_04060 [Candidatus Dependentiae bacterium]